MKTITLNFSDFWPNFDKTNNVFTHLLNKYYQIVIDDEPEFLIYSVYGESHKKYSQAVKILYTGENQLPNFLECDYALSFFYLQSPRHYRLPLYYFYCHSQYLPELKNNVRGEFWCNPQVLIERKRSITAETLKKKRDFCSFVVSNPNCEFRNLFYQKISNYKKVNSGGSYLNNVGGAIADKAAFLNNHKFNIAFENSSSPGYTTEKLLQAYMAETIPIYWGNQLVNRDFNKEAFICVHDFKNIDAVINRVVSLDNDEEQLLYMLNQPLFKNNQINKYIQEDNIINFFDFIFKNAIANRSAIFDINYWQLYLAKESSFLTRRLARKSDYLRKRLLPSQS